MSNESSTEANNFSDYQQVVLPSAKSKVDGAGIKKKLD